MIRIYFSILFIAGISCIEAGNQNPQIKTIGVKTETNDSLILWSSERKLTWNDFQGYPKKESQYDAQTSSWIDFQAQIFSDSIILSVPCYFVKSESWSISKTNSSLLAHEQLHFDIAELAARKIRKSYSNHISKSLKESSKMFQSVYDRYHDERHSLNKNYDTETIQKSGR